MQIIVSRHLIGAASERICFSNEGNHRALGLSGMKRVSGRSFQFKQKYLVVSFFPLKFEEKAYSKVGSICGTNLVLNSKRKLAIP